MSNTFAGYGSVANLVKASGLSRPLVLEYLQASKTYTKYRGAKRKFPRLKARCMGINDIWAVDVAFMDKLGHANNNIKYLFIAVDILSRYLYVEPMRTKSANSNRDALKRIIEKQATKHVPPPEKLWLDEGGEFKGAFETYCSEQGILLYHTFTETKSTFAERFIRSLKSIIHKYMDAKETERYINQLNDFVKIINARKNRVTKIAPDDVTQEHTEYLLSLQRQNPLHLRFPSNPPKFKIGQTVRVAFKKQPFDKGYKQSFSTEVYKIVRIADKQKPITYVIQDVERRNILRRFYEEQLVPYTYNESRKRAQHQRIL